MAGDSPGNQTLADLKREATLSKSEKRSKQTVKSKAKKTAKAVWRSNKVMTEELFEGMNWTRISVSGPTDPRWNPYKLYCQICKGNISIYGRGAKELLRHQSTKRHLRKDQRWRYEHLSIQDPVTGTIQHPVRGKDGKLLTPYELELE